MQGLSPFQLVQYLRYLCPKLLCFETVSHQDLGFTNYTRLAGHRGPGVIPEVFVGRELLLKQCTQSLPFTPPRKAIGSMA